MPQQSVPTGPVSLWEEAGRELARSQQQGTPPAAAPTAPPPSAADTPWTPQAEKSGVRFAQRLGRGLLWGVVVLACVTGLRSWFFPPKVHIPPPAPASTGPTYPTADAQAAAALFTRAYLGWDEAAPQARAAALASLLPSGSDTTMGWDSHGHQDVLAVQAAAVTVGQQGQARVRVLALIRSAVTPAQGAPAPPAQWVALEVPVAQSAGRVVVTGEPGLVGVPAQGPAAPHVTAAPSDSAMTTATQPIVDQFLKAYAAAQTTSTTTSATAPGANIPPLPAGFTYGGLTSWTVDVGQGNTRTGTARVSWTVAGAVIEQTYRVELTQVSSASAQTWQVADVHGGTL
ncbi:conjugal transfer protein [Kitasatospora sp. NPDC059973]|uniref:conjugal transfer protein n=1 Tax=Kitasatospora sp. NPDC059973 TaxID=3347020 RepID=UPI003684A277